MGRLFVTHLEGQIYSCKHCRTHLALYEDIVSKSFHSRHGRAYLFSKVEIKLRNIVLVLFMDAVNILFFYSVNVTVGVNEDRQMLTGMHTVADIFCVGCGSIVGWRYETAHEKSQKYKEGKSVLERYKVSGPDGNNNNNYWVSHEAHVGGSDADDA
ncbi:Protein yippee-like [Glycine soja]|nr:Protein yippee-like [Glycine max]KAH1263323.1 Protein yippee-like [Glycine max]